MAYNNNPNNNANEYYAIYLFIYLFIIIIITFFCEDVEEELCVAVGTKQLLFILLLLTSLVLSRLVLLCKVILLVFSSVSSSRIAPPRSLWHRPPSPPPPELRSGLFLPLLKASFPFHSIFFPFVYYYFSLLYFSPTLIRCLGHAIKCSQSKPMLESSQPCMKVIVIGDGNVGKTSLLRRFVRGDFIDEYRRTIGAEYMEKDVFLRSRNTTAKLMLWDTAGQEMFSPLTQSYYRNSSAAVVCFSTVDKDSFHHAFEWKNQVEQVCGPITTVLCQTKFDLSHVAAITNEEAEALAGSLGTPFFRVSTKDDFNVTQLFEFTAQSVLETLEEQAAAGLIPPPPGTTASAAASPGGQTGAPGPAADPAATRGNEKVNLMDDPENPRCILAVTSTAASFPVNGARHSILPLFMQRRYVCASRWETAAVLEITQIGYLLATSFSFSHSPFPLPSLPPQTDSRSSRDWIGLDGMDGGGCPASMDRWWYKHLRVKCRGPLPSTPKPPSPPTPPPLPSSCTALLFFVCREGPLPFELPVINAVFSCFSGLGSSLLILIACNCLLLLFPSLLRHRQKKFVPLLCRRWPPLAICFMSASHASASAPSIWGVVYNMKVVLRGSRGVGKTCLLARLCGHRLPTTYAPTTSLAAGTIRICGSGCAPHEGTRVDIWDVSELDAPPLPKRSAAVPAGLLSDSVEQALREAWRECYAQMYSDCRCALLVVDASQRASLDFAREEARRIPPDTHIVFVINCCDLPPSTRDITAAEVSELCRSLRRTASGFMTHAFQGGRVPAEFTAPVSFVEVSAKTGAGLQQLVWALDVPNYFTRIEALESRLRLLYSAISQKAPPAVAAPPPPAPAGVRPGTYSAATRGPAAAAASTSSVSRSSSSRSSSSSAVGEGGSSSPSRASSEAQGGPRRPSTDAYQPLPDDPIPVYTGAGAGAARRRKSPSHRRDHRGGPAPLPEDAALYSAAAQEGSIAEDFFADDNDNDGDNDGDGDGTAPIHADRSPDGSASSFGHSPPRAAAASSGGRREVSGVSQEAVAAMALEMEQALQAVTTPTVPQHGAAEPGHGSRKLRTGAQYPTPTQQGQEVCPETKLHLLIEFVLFCVCVPHMSNPFILITYTFFFSPYAFLLCLYRAPPLMDPCLVD
eukprot:gene6689-4787_t